ncbi:MAG: hypothetical protein FWE16_04550 [Firmicutes bacterium]|nr:hypothetical protein [Bacillota bacterium]
MEQNENKQENGQSRFQRHLGDIMVAINAMKNIAANLINRKTVGLVTGVGIMGSAIPAGLQAREIQGNVSFINNMSEETRQKVFEGLSNAEIVGGEIGGRTGEMVQNFVTQNPWVLDAAGHELMPFTVAAGLFALGGAISGTAAYKLDKERTAKKASLKMTNENETPMIDVAIENSPILGDFYGITKEQLTESSYDTYHQELELGRQQLINALKNAKTKKETEIDL